MIENQWKKLQIGYRRDLRLANINNSQIRECTHYLNLGTDFLEEDFYKVGIIAYTRLASILELSQSKGGWFRKQWNKITQETIHGELEPPKKSFFGSRKREIKYNE